MLVAFFCALAPLIIACVVGACINFRKKKTDSPYALSKEKSPLVAGKSPTTDVNVSTANVATTGTKGSVSPRTRVSVAVVTGPPCSTTVASTAASTVKQPLKTVQKSNTKTVSASAEKLKKKPVKNNKTKKPLSGGSSEEVSTLKEDLGDIQLVRPKAKRKNIRELLREYRAPEIRSSEEGASESTKSTDDTLCGVESLKTDNQTSLAPRTSMETLSRRQMKHIHTNTGEVK
ncbi:hypothetical protein RB195_016608 [Necator americanus]|uniref:Uncharacterized protein n=1 Tax=Necator americanus TaxID=51031 RepID=A0ABR1C3U8_NECAM